MQRNFIANTIRRQRHPGATIAVIDPSDGQVFDALQRSNASDIDAAVGAARQCMDTGWGRLTAAERGRLLMQLSHKVAQHADELAAARAARLRQAGQAGACRRRRAGALLRVLCRRLRQAAWRDPALSGRLQRVHLARAAWRHRPHHSVELPDADLRPQRRRRAGRRQYLRRQAGRRRLPVADPGRATGRRGRLSRRARSTSSPATATRSAMRWRAIRASTTSASPAARRSAR